MDIKIISEDDFWYATGSAAGKDFHAEYLMSKRIEYHYLSWADFWDAFIGKKLPKPQ